MATPYLFGFNGQERKDDYRGKGNSYEFKYRGYDSRIGRFTSLDPLAKDYPWNSPYAFAENRVIDGVDLEGREYKSAANWAMNNIADYSIGFMHEKWAPPAFEKLRATDWKKVIGNTMYCSASTSLVYAQGNSEVSQYLSENGFLSERDKQLSFFAKGGWAHSLIHPKDYLNADRGDLLFFQDPNSSGAMTGHIAIVATKPIQVESSSIVQNIIEANGGQWNSDSYVLQVYSTNAGSSNTVNSFGTTFYLIGASNDGSYYLQAKMKYHKGMDKPWEYVDMRKDNDQVQGFGRVNENAIRAARDGRRVKEKPKDDE